MRFKQFDRHAGGCRGAIQRPAKMLAHMAASDAEAMMVKHFIIEHIDQVKLLAKRWTALTRARREITRNLPRQPRPALRRTTNHDGVSTRSGQGAHRIFN